MAIQTFTAAQILTAAQMNALQENDYNQTVSTKTANYVLVAADKGTRVVMNSATATTITVNTSLFAAGDSLRLQNINTGATVVTAGTATVTSAGSLSIPQWGGGQLFFTSASAAVYFPDAATSKFGQIVQTVKSDTYSQTATSFTDITGFSVSITPTLATSQVLVMVDANLGQGDNDTTIRLLRGSTVIFAGTAAGTRPLGFGAAVDNIGTNFFNVAGIFLDSPATTSATTYKVQMLVNAVTGYLNRNNRDTDGSDPRLASSITVIEVLA